MKNVIRILATDELKDMMERTWENYTVDTVYFSDEEGKLTEKIACLQPDAVIMNLFMPGIDAIEIIKAYRLLYADSFTYFAVISPFMTATLKNEMDECGIDRMIVRPYSKRVFNALIAELAQLKTTPLATLKSVGINTLHMLHHMSGPDGHGTANRPGSRIDEVFDSLCLNTNDVGRAFLKRAVLLALDGEGNCSGITKRIYPAVAAEFGTTSSCVERRIRRVICEAWTSEHSAVITSYFGYTVDNMRGRPTNSEFIAALADHIRLEAKA